MDLTFSTASTALYEIGCLEVEKWKTAYPEDEALQSLDHPIVAFDSEANSVGLFEITIDYFGSVMWIDTLWVKPESRLDGVGSSILSYLTKTCKCSKVKLYAANNSSHFYRKNGFFNSVGNYYERRITHV